MSFYLYRNRLEQNLLTDDRIGQTAETGDLDFAIRHSRANKIGFDDPQKKKFYGLKNQSSCLSIRSTRFLSLATHMQP